MYVYINVLHINSKYVKCDYVISNILFITKKISETLIYIFEYVHACTVVLLYSNIKDFLLKHIYINVLHIIPDGVESSDCNGGV